MILEGQFYFISCLSSFWGGYIEGQRTNIYVSDGAGIVKYRPKKCRKCMADFCHRLVLLTEGK